VGQERLGPSYIFILSVLGPLNSPLWYVPSSRYIELGSYFLFLQEQLKDFIISDVFCLKFLVSDIHDDCVSFFSLPQILTCHSGMLCTAYDHTLQDPTQCRHLHLGLRTATPW
jgi:hypothetical protein